MSAVTDKLLSRLQSATEGSVALNNLIARQFGWHRVEPRHGGGKHGGWISPADFTGTMSDGSPILDSLHGTDIWRNPPDFTRNLQDAVSLLPPGPKRFVLYAGPQADDGETVSWGCELGFWVPTFNTEGAESELSPWAMVYGSTAALAVCAAIVAVESSKAEDDPISDLRGQLRAIAQADLDDRP